MAYHIDPTNGDLVIDGFENGIADAPERGIAFMRNLNLVSAPGEANVNYKTAAINFPSNSAQTGTATFTAATDVVDFGGGVILYTGQCVTFTSTTGGVTAGTLYWLSNVSGTTAKIYTDIGHSQLVNLTADTTNGFSTIPFGKPTWGALDILRNNEFILDDAGRAWWVNSSGNLTFIGNTTLTSAHGNGICVLGDYLFVFRDAAMDYLPITYLTSTSAPSWTYGWNSYVLSASSVTGYSHHAINTQDNGMYFCNDQNIQSILIKGGSTFDPATASTYTSSLASSNGYALLLPSVDRSTCLAELGTNILVGGIQNKVYPWNRVATSYNYPLILAENHTVRMVTTNSTTFIFAGNRGRIYMTNGSNIQLFKKVPDHIVQIFGTTNGTDPYFTWKDAIYWKSQIYFSFEAATNAGTVITNLGGIWAIDISLNDLQIITATCLRMVNTLSQATYIPSVLLPNIRTATPAGAGIYAGYYNTLTTGYGVEVTQTTPYVDTDIGGEIYSDLIPTGIFTKPRSFEQVEFKLAKEMVSGESVRMSVRQSNSQSWTVLGTTTSGVLSNIEPFATQDSQWIQVYIELFSTATTPSFVPLKEIRLR